MESAIKALRGSASRDKFKHLHKQMLPDKAYALDVDLELVSKYPVPFIVARIDFKMPSDKVTFAEALSYQEALDRPAPHAIPIYFVEGSWNFKNDEVGTEEHRFAIYRLVSADYRPFPPVIKTELVASNLTWEEFSKWEMGLRVSREGEMRKHLAQSKPNLRERSVGYFVNNN